LNVSSSAVPKTIKRYDESGPSQEKEDSEIPLLQRISSWELTAPQIAAKKKCFTEFKENLTSMASTAF
jgi:hypothetical protein